ncbi:glycosyltransferase family 2 protein [Taklimakanibacter lacteus]|uniref:glycosyltransferase family 2 protein n=1 Tax=Taklimakanibacter lacteus TaxID=2268456 RepID=UPI000E66FCB6
MDIELTILIPCLNEAETLATCIGKSKLFLEISGITGEVLVADNGSTDGSQKIAADMGARVISVPTKGYGAALWAGIKAAKGKFVIMGDADDSYDFSSLSLFVGKLRGGADLVMGNRFRGGIAPGAMPFLHRYLGNPVLSFLGRLFFDIHIGDFHCGLRGFDRERMTSLELRTTGMEFASEMIVRSALAGYRIEEVPATLAKDGRSRPPHLRTWRDGWRHLSFLLVYSPKWLFLYPGLAIMLFGVLVAGLLLPGKMRVGSVDFDIHTFAVGCISTLVGVQAISFAVTARRLATIYRMLPQVRRFTSALDAFTLERVLLVALVCLAIGLAGFVWCIVSWMSLGFGPIQYSSILRILLVSLTAIAIGIQLALTGFLSAILEIPAKMIPPRSTPENGP